MKSPLRVLPACIALCVLVPSASADATSFQPASLDAISRLQDDYAERLTRLRVKLEKKLPAIRERSREAFAAARDAEKRAKAAIAAAEARLGEITTAEALVAHAKGKWIGGADQGIAAARKKLDAASNAAERKAAEDELAHWEQNRREGVQALEERQAALDAIEGQRPEIEREREAARNALTTSERDLKADRKSVV